MAIEGAGLGARFKEERRRRVKRLGKRLIRSLADFLGRQSLVGDTPVLARQPFPFLDAFEARWREIRAEVQEILKYREAVPTFQEVSPDQAKIAKGDNWRTFILYGFGARAERNCARAPLTARLLEGVPNLQTAWFSILAPGYHIPPHRGVSKGIVRCHLGLIVPSEREKCRMRVGDRTCVWREGELFVFDDTYEHEVWNETADERVVLIFDFDRPMRFWGRALNKAFVAGLKRTAYYQVPKRNLEGFDKRFEEAVRQADRMLEGADGGER
jgi:beta-hydroxylase